MKKKERSSQNIKPSESLKMKCDRPVTVRAERLVAQRRRLCFLPSPRFEVSLSELGKSVGKV